jgi:flagellar biosynthetic protein FliR
MDLDYNFTLLLMIFMRMSGCVLFNPILGRKNLPAVIRVGLAAMLTVFTYPFVPHQSLQINSVLVMMVCCIKELLIGMAVGFILQLFQSVIIMGGEQMDMQIGVSMSKIYDPQSNVSMPLSASLLNAMLILIFFATNAHLTLIRVFIKLGEAVPYGDQMIPPGVFESLAGAFSQMLIYAVKLSLPIIAIEMVTQVGIGIIMREVPQIDIFTVEIQLKIIVGFFAIIILAAPFANFLEGLITLMFNAISRIYAMLL